MKRTLQMIFVSFAMIIPMLLPSSVALAACGGGSTAKGEVLSGVGQAGGNCNGSGVNTLISTAVNILSMIVGAVAIIMVIVAGFRYVTSGGDTSAVSSAKRTLVYALVGVAVVALAQFLVHFVFSQALKAQ